MNALHALLLLAIVSGLLMLADRADQIEQDHMPAAPAEFVEAHR